MHRRYWEAIDRIHKAANGLAMLPVPTTAVLLEDLEIITKNIMALTAQERGLSWGRGSGPCFGIASHSDLREQTALSTNYLLNDPVR